MYQRTLSQTIQEVTKSFPIVLVTGPRQVGKTTLLEMCAPEQRGYVTLDDMEVRQLAQNDPGLFVQRYPYPLIIDEIQYAPQLFSYLKIMVDRHKKNGMYWLTGSQKFSLMQGITESLAGRVAVLDLLGLSQSELNHHGLSSRPFIPTPDWIQNAREQANHLSLQDIFQRIWLGSFPRAHEIKSEQKDIFYRSYVQTYIQRDVKDILHISDDAKFTRFLTTIAARTGQLLNYTELSRDVGIDVKTVTAWLSILETSGLIYLLRPYHTNITKRLIKTPKLYFLDTGLATYLTKWPDALSLEAGAMSGAILETYLISELLKTYLHNGLTPNFYFYRDFDKKEIDLLIEQGDTLYPIEFKKTATPSVTASKNFHHAENLGKKIGCGAVICFIEKDIPLSRDVQAIPISYL